ncbi:hypothetical protein [Streptomyces sp. NBC_01439]|uniref:hypothetical protein n=1 Tax=Streptomyces sp. NBC_01439 TaxID=2903867 RepID=UPI002E2DB760|nr:hypothetical protein [Streptomyces sp. NBC_01439]
MASQLSVQEVETFRTLQRSRVKWLSSREVHALTPNTADRTVRAVLTKLTQRGVLDYVEVYPGRRYRLAESAEHDHADYFALIAQAAAALSTD